MDIELKVDGEDIELTGYPTKVVFEIISGILRTLRGVDADNWQKAEIVIEK